MNDYFLYRKKIYCSDTNETCIGYKQYLKSKHWLKLRTTLVSKDSICSMCQCKCNNLQLHHITYSNLGNEQFYDLIVLCDKCHKLIHTTDVKISSELSNYYRHKANTRNVVRNQRKQKRSCKNCKYHTYIKVGKNKLSTSYCNYTASLYNNCKGKCEHHKYKNC